MRGFLLLAFCFLSFHAFCQRIQFGAPFLNGQRPMVVGKVGENYHAIWTSHEGRRLQVFDTGLSLLQQPVALMANRFFSNDSTVVYLQQFPKDSLVHATVSARNASGAEVYSRQLELGERLGFLPEPFSLIHSATPGAHAFYRLLSGQTSESLFLEAVVLDSTWNSTGSVFFSFPIDPELEVVTAVTVDRFGGVHLIVADRPDNYRLSTRLKVFTASPGGAAVTSGEVILKDKKLRNVSILPGKVPTEFVLQALSLNGNTKDTEGFVFLRIPVKRGRQITQSYEAFQPSFWKTVSKKGLRLPPQRLMNDVSFRAMAQRTDDFQFTGFVIDPTKLSPQRNPFSSASDPRLFAPANPFTAGGSFWQQRRPGVGSGRTFGFPQLPVSNPMLVSVPGVLVTYAFRDGMQLMAECSRQLFLARTEANEVLALSPNGQSIHLAYLVNDLGKPFLAQIWTDTEGKSRITELKEARGKLLLLKLGKVISDREVLAPYVDEKKEAVGFCRITW